MNLFDYNKKPFKFGDKKIRVFEAFAGTGCQALALKRIEANFEVVGISEIDKYAIKSYEAIHGNVNNLGDILNITPEQLDNLDIDLFTYSFPCTNISVAGKMQGITKDTASGLVLKILELLKGMKKRPKILLMENVKNLLSDKFISDFNYILNELESLGYDNYFQVLNAKDYGIPQNRERVFMVSIFSGGGKKYVFPKPQELQIKALDLLEKDVEKKYYLSEKMLKSLTNDKPFKNGKSRKDIFNPINYQETKKEYIATITTKDGIRSTGNFIIDKKSIRKLSDKECCRFMGFTDLEYEKISKAVSSTQLRKIMGNGIVVNVLMAIFKEMIE